MSAAETEDVVLTDEEFEQLEAALVSEDVPADCMNLEMLDGFLVAVVCSPEPIAPERWLPCVWTAEGDADAFAQGASPRRVLRLVLRYHNEVLATIGAEQDPWQPFCYAPEGDDAPALGDEWVAGFEQGIELWPEDWSAGLDSEDVAVAEGLLDRLLRPWAGDDAANADDETRLAWLEESAGAARGLYALWREIGLDEAEAVETAVARVATGLPGRNEACPCGSGKKYKKCCGVEA